ncbi:putative ammonium transporter 1 [Blattella germanica]|nr:putative ammonium transporter 1 [Blattella germanica]
MLTYRYYSRTSVLGIVYPPISHWVWSEAGWLNKLGYVDFSGCGPVHLLGGVCSFFGAAFLGPRIGRFVNKYNGSEKEELVGHSIPLVGIGGMILIAGFLSFNGGSLGTMVNPGDGDIIARVISNTVLGGTGGSIFMLFATKLGLYGEPSWNFSGTLNAALIGMVSVCSGVNSMEMWAAFLCGFSAGPVYIFIHNLMIWCKVDDPLDAVAVHFGGGLWGLIAANFFDNNGFLFNAPYDAAMLMAYRMIGAAAIIAWGTAFSVIMFGSLKFVGKLRVSEEDELKGLDIAMHNEPGYDPMGWKTYPPVTTWQASVLPIIDPSHRGVKSRNNHNYKLRTSDFSNAAFEDTERDGHTMRDSSKL